MKLLPLLLLLPTSALAAAFERPVPQPQPVQAEVWFAVASLALILSLGAVQWLVARR